MYFIGKLLDPSRAYKMNICYYIYIYETKYI